MEFKAECKQPCNAIRAICFRDGSLIVQSVQRGVINTLRGSLKIFNTIVLLYSTRN